ncbi:MAG: hypothetical protein LUD02_01210 [Tannerellaceae bacterium]|nr:hypothetical protein [Tannerellaceae bacterium]MCD8262923.1 hypothetical protein [Tannerellaceae bacterium]
MKKVKLLFLVTCLSLSLYSCLGDSPTTMVLGAREGVVEVGTTKLIHLKEHVFYASNFQSVAVDNDACYLFDIRFDSGDPLNKTSIVEDSTGYYTGDVISITGPIDQFTLSTTLTDTTVAYRNDRLVTSMYDEKYALIKGKLFLYTQLKERMSLEIDSFSLSVDLQQDFEVDDEGRKIYDFYFRAFEISVPEESDSTIVSERLVKVFDINEFFRKADPSWEEDHAKEYHFRINYPTAFNSDTTVCIWSRTSNIYTLEVTSTN